MKAEGEILEVDWFRWRHELDDRQDRGHIPQLPILELYNKCWEQGGVPSDWYETRISYIL